MVTIAHQMPTKMFGKVSVLRNSTQYIQEPNTNAKEIRTVTNKQNSVLLFNRDNFSIFISEHESKTRKMRNTRSE